MDDVFKHIPIIDAHQHFWNPTINYHPWLCDEPPIAFRYGDYSALRRPYLPSDYLRDTSDYPVAATVYIETEWAANTTITEMQYVAQLRTETGYPNVAVAHAQLDDPDVGRILAQLEGIDFVRGIRHKPRAHPAPGDCAPGGMLDDNWRRGYAQLADHGLRFDLQTPWWHLHEAASLANDFPATPLIINHAGLPADRSHSGLSAWRDAIRDIADCPNVSIKLSGLGSPGQSWTTSANQDIVLYVIETFGVDRCMFASNFPVDGLCAPFSVIFDGFAQITRALGDSNQHKLFHKNAARIYDIKQAPQTEGDPHESD